VNTQRILAALDAEIARLQEARNLIADFTSVESGRGRRVARLAVHPAKRRVLSSAAREKIAAAQRRRWAKQKTAKKAAPGEKPAKTVRRQKTASTRKASAKAKKTVQVTKLPARTRPERKPRAAKNATAGNALSSRAEVVAVNKPELPA
jgi:hypothetical protein